MKKIPQHVLDFIASVSVHFPPPRGLDESLERAWLESISRSLEFYKPDVIAAAAQLILDERGEMNGVRRFPLPKEIKQACHEVLNRRSAEQRASTLPIAAESDNQFADWRVRLADELIMTAMGRDAARGGWILGLHEFCRREARAPNDREIPQIRREAKEFDAAYETCVMGGWPEARGLERLGRSMLDRREALRQRVLGDGA